MNYLLSFILLLSLVRPAAAQQLVMRGDHPDPSVVKIGDTYWASATTSNWFPAYPLLKSKDLVNWQQQGYVFNQMPGWADYYFWAPEISHENGKTYIYYSAHKKGGNLCIGVASADRPEGPYKDHGPLMCQEAGSIDAFPMRDEKGKLYIIWKEDGNSVNKPTPIWAQELNEERTSLVGEKKELFRNDQPWEKNLVEGVSMMKHGDYFYAFYAAAGCCGRECTYVSGIARSKSLMGPWEKYSKNPILTGSEQWKCPGHGTPVEKDGRFYFLYHAYDKKTDVYTGREGLLIEFRFTPDGWLEFLPGQAGAGQPAPAPALLTENFRGQSLADRWQWSVFQPAQYRLKGGDLLLTAQPTPSGAFLGQKTLSGDYEATVVVRPRKTDAAAGIAVIGDEKNLVSALYENGTLNVYLLRDGKTTEPFHKAVGASRKLYLQVEVRNGKDMVFRYSTDGKRFQVLNDKPVDGSFLPPWDRALRVGLLAKGSGDAAADFESFTLKNL